jgi:hypothetical protein
MCSGSKETDEVKLTPGFPPPVIPRLDRGTGFGVHYGTMFYVYIMTNRIYGTLYVGVTNDLGRRAWEHREGMLSRSTSLSYSSTTRPSTALPTLSIARNA